MLRSDAQGRRRVEPLPVLDSARSMFSRLPHLILLAVCIPLTAACGSAGTVPVSSELEVSGREPTDIHLRADTRTVEQIVPRSSTLASLLAGHGLAGRSFQLIEQVRSVFNPRRLRVGHPYRLVFNNVGGGLRRFEYHVDEDEFLRVTVVDTGFNAELVPYVKERHEVTLAGVIDADHNSLVAVVDAGGENVMLAIAMAEVFGGEIDFNNDLRRGDSFDVLFEKVYREGTFSGYGDVLATEFVNDGRRVQVFRFHVPGEAEAQYFDETGRSTKRLFLRSPFRFEPRVTSRFSYRRVHPVLGGVRPHLGVDYGAPTGTPVVAVANGTVVSAARSGGSGNMVRLRHTNGYETYYLHLSAFGKGVRPGVRVAQGQVIGRVGSTGLATGPHLDYRMRKGGAFVNPLLEHRNLPPGEPVPEGFMNAFVSSRDSARERMARDSSAVEEATLAQ